MRCCFALRSFLVISIILQRIFSFWEPLFLECVKVCALWGLFWTPLTTDTRRLSQSDVHSTEGEAEFTIDVEKDMSRVDLSQSTFFVYLWLRTMESGKRLIRLQERSDCIVKSFEMIILTGLLWFDLCDGVWGCQGKLKDILNSYNATPSRCARRLRRKRIKLGLLAIWRCRTWRTTSAVLPESCATLSWWAWSIEQLSWIALVGSEQGRGLQEHRTNSSGSFLRGEDWMKHARWVRLLARSLISRDRIGSEDATMRLSVSDIASEATKVCKGTCSARKSWSWWTKTSRKNRFLAYSRGILSTLRLLMTMGMMMEVEDDDDDQDKADDVCWCADADWGLKILPHTLTSRLCSSALPLIPARRKISYSEH